MQYPASTLDNPDQMLSFLGSFWSETYLGQDLAREIIKARSDLAKQFFLRTQEAADTLSRLQCPVFRKNYWYHLTLNLSDRGTRPARYGLTSIPYQTGGLDYDGPDEPPQIVFPCPSNLASVQTIFNRIESPTASLFLGIDFWLESGFIRFAVDPFSDPRFSVNAITANGVTIGQELDLWLYRPDFDDQYVYNHWGFVAGIQQESSQTYKDLVNDVLDMNVLGTSIGRTESACCRTMGLPVAVGGDKILSICDDAVRTLVLTDQAAYLLPLGSTSSLGIGDTFYANQSVSSAVQVYEFNQGQGPRDLPGLTLGRGFLVGNFTGELGFVNRDVPLMVSVDEEGRTEVKFEIGGHPADVEKFWNETQKRGVASGKTLAQRLDTRTNPVGDPDASQLPATINPLGFMLENVLRNNVFVIRLDIGGVSPDAVGISKLNAVTRMIQPHTALLIVLEAAVIEDDTTPEDDSLLGFADGGETIIDDTEIYETQTVITGRVVSGRCQ